MKTVVLSTSSDHDQSDMCFALEILILRTIALLF